MFGLFINLFECCFVIFFLYSLNPKHKPHAVLYSIISASVLFISIQIINQYAVSQSLLILGFISVNFIYLILIFDKPWSELLLYANFPYLIISVTNVLIDLTVLTFIFPDMNIYKVLDLYGVPFDIFIQLIHVIEFYYLARFIRSTDLPFTDKEFLTAAFLSILCIVISTVFESVYLGFGSWKLFMVIGIYCVFLLVVLIIGLFTLIYQRSLKEAHDELTIAIAQNQLVSNEKITESYHDIMRMRHDMKHLVNALKASNGAETYGETAALLEKYDDMLNEASVPLQTISPALNYVLNIKKEEAVRKKIDITFSINITRMPEIDASDLCLIISNLMDNAVQHIGLRKIIRVTLLEVNEMLMFRVVNSVDRVVVDQDGNFIRKNVSEGHGYGLLTAKHLLNKYNGVFIAEQQLDDVSVAAFVPFHPSHFKT